MIKRFIINIWCDILRTPILWVWQLPQHLVGLGLLAYFKIRKVKIEHRHLICNNRGYYTYGIPNRWYGVSFGNFIFIGEKNYATEFHGAFLFDRYKNMVFHEYGHAVQSRMFGPLYLIIIGIPSAIVFWSSTIIKLCASVERWADKLGGVKK